MAEKEAGMATDMLSTNAIKSNDVLVAMTQGNEGANAVRLTPDVIEAIKKLERYAILSSHRIGEFRVG